MNKDKRVVVQVLADLCGAYSTQRSVPHKVLMIIRDAVKELAESEQRSLKKMEPFKDNAGTAANYQRSADCLDDLRSAQDALEEAEVEEAWPLLLRVAKDDYTIKVSAPKKQLVTRAKRGRS